MSRATALFLLLLLVLVTACGGSKRLNTDDVERKIGAAFTEQRKLPVEGVTCPRKRRVKAGDVFTCTLTVAGSKVAFRVRQRGGGRVSAEATRSIVDLRRAESTIAQTITRQTGSHIRAECGKERVVLKDPGDTFQCIAFDASGEPVAVTVTVKDLVGNISLQAAQ